MRAQLSEKHFVLGSRIEPPFPEAMQSAGESPPVPVALALALALALAQWPMGPALASKPNARGFFYSYAT